MTRRRALIAFGWALAASVAVNLPRQLARRHHASRHVAVQVFAAVATDVIVALVLWGLFVGARWLAERRRGGPGPGGGQPPASGGGTDDGSRAQAEASFGSRRAR